MYNSSLVIQQILSERLLVKVAFVGPNLAEVVEHMEAARSKYMVSSTNAMIDPTNLPQILHFSPSALVLKHHLAPILFPPCKDPLLQRNHRDPACYYASNRLAKVVWKHLQTAASELYTFIQAFGFGSYEEYVDLLRLHVLSENALEEADYEETVCSWMRELLPAKTGGGRVMRYQEKLSKLQPSEKPQLFIGGIFPITGTKYLAPELAAGARHCFYILMYYHG